MLYEVITGTLYVLLATLLAFIFGAGSSALALVHPDVTLRGPGGEYIDLDAVGPQPAYSSTNTCGGCHTYARITSYNVCYTKLLRSMPF